MRSVILLAGITLDGYLARPDDSIDYLEMTKEGEKDLTALFASADTVIMGRKTYDISVKLGGGTYQPPSPKTETFVFSRTLPPGERGGVVFTRQSPGALLKRIRARRGKSILHMGGGELARTFLAADLIDELALGVVPILLGSGIPLFPAAFPQRDFTLVDNKTYSKGQIYLVYRRARSKAKRKGRSK